MNDYESVIVGVMFDENYQFEDIFVHGVAHSPTEAFAIEQEEIMRLYEDFGEEPVVYSESRSAYDYAISVIKYSGGYEHIYCMFPNGTPEEIRKRRKEEQKNEQNMEKGDSDSD